MGGVSEEDLIDSVARIKLASADALTAKQVHEALTSEGVVVDFSAVKKAASKAAKRTPAALPPAPVQALPEAPAQSKSELKKANAKVEALKAAEVAMFTALKALHEERWMVALHGEQRDTKAFIDSAAAGAISGALAAGEPVGKERVDADVATLQYILLAGSPFELAEEERKMAEAQLEKLGRCTQVGVGRLAKPFVAVDHFQGFRQGFVFMASGLGLGYYHEAWFAAAKQCYVAAPAAAAPAEAEEEPAAPVDPALREILDQIDRGTAGSTASLDRAMAKAAALTASSGSAMDDMD